RNPRRHPRPQGSSDAPSGPTARRKLLRAERATAAERLHSSVYPCGLSYVCTPADTDMRVVLWGYANELPHVNGGSREQERPDGAFYRDRDDGPSCCLAGVSGRARRFTGLVLGGGLVSSSRCIALPGAENHFRDNALVRHDRPVPRLRVE